MQYGYLLKISNKNIYKEVQIPVDAEVMKIGMGIDCDVRFYKESFFEDFELVLQKKSNEWNITCSDNVFIDAGDVRKLITKKLSHGDSFAIKYQKSENEVFKIDFVYDFDNENKDYSRVIDITSKDKITIGNSSNCNICINSEYVRNDFVELNKPNEDLILAIKSTTCGVYHNGNLAVNGEVIKNGDFFSIANFSFYYKNGAIITCKNVIVSSLSYTDLSINSNYPKFNRNTRLKTQLDKKDIEILDPPKKPSKPQGNIIMQLLPALFMIALTVVVRGFMGGGSNSSFIIFSVCSMSIGIVTSIVSMITERKKYKTESIERVEKYNEYINNKRLNIENYRNDELRKLNDIYIDNEKEIENVHSFSGNLFDKTENDKDFLQIYLGTGLVEAEKRIAYKKQEKLEADDELSGLPQLLSNEYRNINNAPIHLDVKNDGVIGIVGSNEQLYDFSKNIVIDICTRHYYTDVELFFLIPENEEKQYAEWLRFFPHLNTHKEFRNIVYNNESKNIIFEYLFVELERRSKSKKNENLSHIVVNVLCNWEIKTHPLSKYIPFANELNVTFIFFENSKYELPLNCTELVYLNNDNSILINSDEKDTKHEFSYKVVDDKIITTVSKLLAPIYCEEISLENSLTKNITLFELLNIISPEDINLESRWNNSEIYKTMAAPIGVKTKDAIVYLDLHEKHHGPHGLVAGTTGSGKSEVLQTYILSMATLFHPYEVGFVIIDFKGGGMVNQFKNLPHLIGAITNIDGREINRSLMSIKAELQKRQKLFAENNVNNINNYIKLYKQGKITTPIPHLILVVDEFAELKAEQPEFMKELISAARIGRSLGVHLILATQKPAGQVNDQIWSNSKFKLCLKVQTKEDSNEVLKSPLAAEIKEPGRAYLQVGNNEIFELFQSAYSGSPANAEYTNKSKGFNICEYYLGGKRKVIYQQKNKKSDDVVATQLDVIVDYINNYCQTKKIRKLDNICLPSLPELINYVKQEQTVKDIKINCNIGLFDDPSNQLQDKYSLTLSNGNVAIIGSSQYGKTNLIQLIIRSLAEKYTAKEINMYILDFGSMALKVYDNLNHVGGVITASDDEKMKHFIKMINKGLSKRKEVFSNLGITSYHSYVEAGYKDIPQVLILIDNFIALKELYSEYEEDLLNICREGASFGVNIVMTSQQTNGISYKYMSNFPTKIAMYCNSSDEYGSLFDRCRMEPKNVPGRCLVEIDKQVYECQTYLAFDGEREIDRVEKITSFINEVNDKNDGLFAIKIPEVPQVLDKEYVANTFENRINYQLPVGIDYNSVEFVILNLLKSATISVTGKEKSGKTNLVKIIMDYCQENVFDFNVEAYLIDGYEHQLEQFSSYGFVEQYTIDTNEIDNILNKFEVLLKERKDMVQENGIETIEKEPLLLCVIENDSVFDSNTLSKQTVDIYKRIINSYKQFKVMFVFSNVPNVAVAYGSADILKMVKDADLTFIFEDLANSKMFDFNAATLRKFKKPIELGDAYLVNNTGDIAKIKTINCSK